MYFDSGSTTKAEWKKGQNVKKNPKPPRKWWGGGAMSNLFNRKNGR